MMFRFRPTHALLAALLLPASARAFVGSAERAAEAPRQAASDPTVRLARPTLDPAQIAARRYALEASAPWREFVARHGAWRAMWNERTGTPHRAIGPAIPLQGMADDSASVDRAVRRFVREHEALFGGTVELATVAVVRHDRTWYARYRQLLRGLPVLDSDWEFRVGANGRLALFGADAHHLAFVPATGRLARGVARAAALAGVRFDPTTDRIDESPAVALLPIPIADGFDYRPVHHFRVRTLEPAADWDTYVDAVTGAVIERTNRVREAVSGRVIGLVHPAIPTDPLTLLAFPHLKLFVAGDSTETNELGRFSAPAPETALIQANLSGPFCEAFRYDAPNAHLERTVIGTRTSTLSWDFSNSHDAERDGFYHVTAAHDYAKRVDPAFTGLDSPTPCTVNIPFSACNAFWNGVGVFFYHAGFGCVNTATASDVIFHEYGHGVNDRIYQEALHDPAAGMNNSVLQEGTADINASLIGDTHEIGRGFYGVGTFVRDLQNTNRWPESASPAPHPTGTIVGGAMWDVRQALGLDLAGHLAFFAKYGVPDDVDAGVAMYEFFLEVLVADDDDANIAKGTPHSAAIVDAFNRHGIGTGFAIAIDHAPLADQASPDDHYAVTAVVTDESPLGALDESSITLHVSRNGGPDQEIAMTPTANPSEWAATIAAPPATVVRYWISASDSYGGVGTSPPGAPAVPPHVFITGPAQARFTDDFESDRGWVVGVPGDDATKGIWARGEPFGTFDGQIQPELDHTPDPANQCWVTGNIPTSDPNLDDVDDGKTTLLSPVFDATLGGTTHPVVEYWRWFTNDRGNDPGTDFWRVDVSNDSGATWTTLERTNQSRVIWTREVFRLEDFVAPSHLMRLRFVAEDRPPGSLVEAAIDDFRFLVFPPDETDVLLALFEANAGADGVRLRWQLGEPERVARVTLERGDGAAGPWTESDAEIGDDDGVTTALDRDVEAGRTYWYRLRLALTTGETLTFGPLVATAGEAVTTFALGPIAPNPARRDVRIDFTVPREAPVRLAVHDLQGREVAVLVDGAQRPGRYQATWTGRGERGRVADGVYFVTLRAGTTRLVRRVVIAH